jgi:outer membrane putative beta-barrel porin/alpha-amylase
VKRCIAPLASAAVVAACLPGAAAEPPTDPSCEGAYSLFKPVPDACLGVIDTDRPHQTDTPHVVPAGHAQFELALAALQLGGTLGAPPGERRAHVVLFENAYKFGVASGVDVQFIFKHADYVPARRLEPPGPLNVRAKLNVVAEEGATPAVTIVPWLFLPVARQHALRGGPFLFWGWGLWRDVELEMNAGIVFGAKPEPAATLVLASALTYTVVDEARVFVEARASGPDAVLGTGALWAFARDMQIDLGTYVGLAGDESVATPFLGFSLRR